MDLLTPTFLVIISLSAILFRRPFQNFPLDDDFAIYTYRAHFASQGFQWKKDLQMIGIPMWKITETSIDKEIQMQEDFAKTFKDIENRIGLLRRFL